MLLCCRLLSLRPLLLIAGVAAARAAGFTMDATTAMGMLALATWLSALFQLFMFERRLGTVVPPGRKTFEMRVWLNTALPIVLVWGMYTLLTSTDVLVLKISARPRKSRTTMPPPRRWR